MQSTHLSPESPTEHYLGRVSKRLRTQSLPTHLGNCQEDQNMEIKVEGWAQLCVATDRSWIQGHIINKDDDGFLTIRGARSGTNGSKDFRLTIHDEEQYLDYKLEEVEMHTEDHRLFLQSKNIEFESKIYHHGQKADIIIQSFLPMFVGQRLDVFEGQMKITTTQSQSPIIPYPMFLI